LSLMGGDYMLYTKFYSDDTLYTDGVIDGNLYIKGFGNSLFTTEDLIDMVDTLWNLGIRKITGKIIGDDSYFDEIYTRDDWITDEVANVKLPPISSIVIDNNRKITRLKRRGRYRNYYINIDNPPLYAAQLLKEKLIASGISVESGAEKGITPEYAVQVTAKGVELSEVIQFVNKESDNFLAECLFKTIGAIASGEQGNAFYSTQTILTYISDNGIFAEGTAIVD